MPLPAGRCRAPLRRRPARRLPSMPTSARTRRTAAASICFAWTRATGALTQLQVIDDIRNPTWLAVNPAADASVCGQRDRQLPGIAQRRGGVVRDRQRQFADQTLGRGEFGRRRARLCQRAPFRQVRVRRQLSAAAMSRYFRWVRMARCGEATDVRPSVGARHRARAVDDPPGQFALSDHDSPHMHMVAADPGGNFVIANDAGLDLTLVWRFDAQAGRLLPADVPVIAAPSGAAPRHFVFHPNGRYFYNLYEHDAKVAVYDYDAVDGRPQAQATGVERCRRNSAAAICPRKSSSTADGRFLYVVESTAQRSGDVCRGERRSTAHDLRGLGACRLRRAACASIPAGSFCIRAIRRAIRSLRFASIAASGALQFTGRFEPVGSPAVMIMLKRA